MVAGGQRCSRAGRQLDDPHQREGGSMFPRDRGGHRRPLEGGSACPYRRRPCPWASACVSGDGIPLPSPQSRKGCRSGDGPSRIGERRTSDGAAGDGVRLCRCGLGRVRGVFRCSLGEAIRSLKVGCTRTRGLVAWSDGGDGLRRYRRATIPALSACDGSLREGLGVVLGSVSRVERFAMPVTKAEETQRQQQR